MAGADTGSGSTAAARRALEVPCRSLRQMVMGRIGRAAGADTDSGSTAATRRALEALCRRMRQMLMGRIGRAAGADTDSGSTAATRRRALAAPVDTALLAALMIPAATRSTTAAH